MEKDPAKSCGVYIFVGVTVENFSINDLIWRNTVIVVRRNNDGKVGLGVGCAVGNDLVLTAAHCTKDSDHLPTVIHPFTNSEDSIVAIEPSAELDLALLRITTSRFSTIPRLKFVEKQASLFNGKVTIPDIWKDWRRSASEQNEDRLAKLTALTPAFRTGKVVGRYREPTPSDFLVFNLPIRKGFSGSPIVLSASAQILSVATKGGRKGIASRVHYVLTGESSFTTGPAPWDAANFVASASEKLLKQLSVG